jgi:hypothetical protein
MHYAPSSAYQQAQVMARLSAWLAAEGLEASDLTPTVIARFVGELRRSGYRNARSWSGLGTLLGLSAAGGRHACSGFAGAFADDHRGRAA